MENSAIPFLIAIIFIVVMGISFVINEKARHKS